MHWWEPLKIIPEFYESEVFEAYIAFHEGIRELPNWCEPFFEYFPKDVRGRLLDIGCGDGVFLKHDKEVGFEVWGIDFDKKSVEIARKGVGADTIFAMSLEEFYQFAKEKGLKFDVITFFEVLEHQDKPKDFLRMVKGLLKNGGYIAGSVPNRESFFLIELHQKKYSWIDHPPNHFLRFSKASLAKALKINGFSDVEVYSFDFPFRDLFPYVEKRFLGNMDSFKTKLKALALGDRRKALAYAVEDLPKVSQRKGMALGLMVLKLIRNALLLPLAIPYIGKLKGNDIFIFFMAKKDESKKS